MSSELQELWMKERAGGLGRLAGSRASGVVPIRQPVVDLLLQRLRRPGSIEDVRVRLQSDNVVHVSVMFRVLGFRKRLEVPLRVAPALDLHNRPTLHLFFMNATLLGTVGRVIAPLFPRGLSVTRDGIIIDLQDALARMGAGDALRHVRAVALEGHEGVLWLNIEVEISPPPATDASSAPMSAVSGGSGVVSLEDAMAAFAGTDLALRLCMQESLATDAAEALLSDMQRRPARGGSFDWLTLARVSGKPRIRFEPQVVILETELRL